jgi:hypothetical protein
MPVLVTSILGRDRGAWKTIGIAEFITGHGSV